MSTNCCHRRSSTASSSTGGIALTDSFFFRFSFSGFSTVGSASSTSGVAATSASSSSVLRDSRTSSETVSRTSDGIFSMSCSRARGFFFFLRTLFTRLTLMAFFLGSLTVSVVTRSLAVEGVNLRRSSEGNDALTSSGSSLRIASTSTERPESLTGSPASVIAAASMIGFPSSSLISMLSSISISNFALFHIMNWSTASSDSSSL